MKPLRPYSSGGSMPMMARNVALRWISSPIASSRGESPVTPGRRLNAAMTSPTMSRMRVRAESMVSFLSDEHPPAAVRGWASRRRHTRSQQRGSEVEFEPFDRGQARGPTSRRQSGEDAGHDRDAEDAEECRHGEVDDEVG